MPKCKQTRAAVSVRCAAVKAAWERIEDAEPDISTERLMAMVANATGEDYGDIASLVAD